MNGYLSARNSGAASMTRTVDVSGWQDRTYCGAQVLVNPGPWENYPQTDVLDAATGRRITGEGLLARGNSYEPLHTYDFDLGAVRTVQVRIWFGQREKSPSWQYLKVDELRFACEGKPPNRWP